MFSKMKSWPRIRQIASANLPNFFGLAISGNSMPCLKFEKLKPQEGIHKKNSRIQSKSQQHLGRAARTEGSEISTGRVETTDILENLKEPKADENLRTNFLLSKRDGTGYVWNGNQNTMLGPLARAVAEDSGESCSNRGSYFGKGLRLGPMKYQSERSEKAPRKFVTFMAKDKDGNAKKFQYVKKGYSRTPRAKSDFMVGGKTNKSLDTNCIFNPFHYGSEKLKTGGTVTDDGFSTDVGKLNTSPSKVAFETDQSGMLGKSTHPVQAINVFPGSARIVKQIIPTSERISTSPVETTRDFGKTPSIMIEDGAHRSMADSPFGQPMPIRSFRKLFLDPESKLGCTRNSGFASSRFANFVNPEKASSRFLDSSPQKPPRFDDSSPQKSPFDYPLTPGLEDSK
jgi:hypothetical protein